MPHSLSQWLVYIGVVAVGVLVSLGLQHVFALVVFDPVKVVAEARKRAKKLQEKLKAQLGDETPELPSWQVSHLGTGLQGWVGAIEIILYASSVVFEHPEFIAVWFATKYVAAYKVWSEDPVGRTFYNRSLFGSGLNILIGFSTGRAALWAISLVGSVTHRP